MEYLLASCQNFKEESGHSADKLHNVHLQPRWNLMCTSCFDHYCFCCCWYQCCKSRTTKNFGYNRDSPKAEANLVIGKTCQNNVRTCIIFASLPKSFEQVSSVLSNFSVYELMNGTEHCQHLPSRSTQIRFPCDSSCISSSTTIVISKTFTNLLDVYFFSNYFGQNLYRTELDTNTDKKALSSVQTQMHRCLPNWKEMKTKSVLDSICVLAHEWQPKCTTGFRKTMWLSFVKFESKLSSFICFLPSTATVLSRKLITTFSLSVILVKSIISSLVVIFTLLSVRQMLDTVLFPKKLFTLVANFTPKYLSSTIKTAKTNSIPNLSLFLLNTKECRQHSEKLYYDNVDKSALSQRDTASISQAPAPKAKYLPPNDQSDRQLAVGCDSQLNAKTVDKTTMETVEYSNVCTNVLLESTTARSNSIKCFITSLFQPTFPIKSQAILNRALSNIYLKSLFFTMLMCLCLSSAHSSANIRAIEKRILDSIIGDGRYDSRIRPMGNASVGARGGDGPSMVFVNILIRSISKISDLDMEYSVQVTFREQWVDNRLKFDNMSGQIRYLVLTDPNRVWRPDLFFKNEKEGHFHEIIMPNVLLRIYPEGDVLYSIRISLVLACPMNLKYYPLDKQICSIQMASYGYTTEDLMFVWKKEDPVQITTNLHLPRFTLEKYLTDYCTSKTNTGSYSCLKVDLLFKREFSYYLIQIYIPCCMLVIVSWVSFWLDPNAIPARVSLGVTTLLTMATSISGINSSLPPVSYTKAIDVWTGVCLTFVFGALLEFALVNYASRSDAHRAALKQQQAAFAAQRKWDMEHAAALENDHIDDRTASAFAMRPLVRQHGDFHGEKMRACEIHVTLPKRNWCKRWLSKFPTRSKRIDVISRIFFPLMFALFNLVYWTTYLFREDMQDL